MQQVLRLLETPRFRSGYGTCGSLRCLGGDGAQRPHDAGAAGPRRPHARRRQGACSGPVGGRFRPAAAPRGRAQAGDRPRGGGDGRRGRGGRARLEHDRLLPRARAALEARARRRHERPARRGRARRRARNHGARHGRDAATVGDVARRRSRHRRPAHDADQQGLPRRARAEPRARPDGSQPGRGADQAGDGGCVRAGVSGSSTATKWHRSALLSFVPVDDLRRHRHRLERARRTRSRHGATPASTS